MTRRPSSPRLKFRVSVKRDPRSRQAAEALVVLASVAAEDADYAKQRNGRTGEDSTRPTPQKALPLRRSAVVEVAQEKPVIHYLQNPVTVAHQTPRTREEIALRDAVRARLAIVETAIVDFVAEKTAEGFTMTDIDQLYALKLPLVFGYRVDGGRIRAQYDGQIVERAR